MDFCFKGGISHGIYVSTKGAFWRKPSGDFRFYSKDDINEVLVFIIKNAYFQVGDKIFRQMIGIPMGSDPAPFIANLFLYFYEDNFLSKLKKDDIARARKFRHIFRFIDDLISLNDDDEFLRSYLQIYPSEMKLKLENQSTQSASFYDLDLEINDKMFESKLYDKREAFQFSVVRMPYHLSDIPSKIFYSTISAEVLRICRATTKFSSFLTSTKKLLLRMKKQGALQVGIRRVLLKMMGRHWPHFKKFLKTAKEIVSEILL